jgi:hypothetical protein
MVAFTGAQLTRRGGGLVCPILEFVNYHSKNTKCVGFTLGFGRLIA